MIHRTEKTNSKNKSPPNVIFVWLDLDRKIKPAVSEVIEIENGDESKLLAQMEYSDYQNCEARIQLNDYLNDHYWTRFKHLIETLTEKLGL